MQPYKILAGHKDYVTSLAFLGQEKLVSSSFDNSIKIWDLKNGKELYTLDEHKGEIYSLALSPDGKILASRTLDEGIICWRMEHAAANQFRLQQRIQICRNVTSLAFSPDNQTLAIGESFDKNRVHLYNTKAKNHQTILSMDSRSFVMSLAFSPDNKTLVVTTSDNLILFYDLVDHKSKLSVTGHVTTTGSEGIFCVAFSPDGKTIATGGIDHTVRIWDVKTGKELSSLVGHTQIVKSVSFSPNGKLLASGAGEGYREAGELKIWDLTLHKELVGFSAHTNPIRVVSFSPDGKLVATGSEDKTVKLWKTAELLFRPM
ncbi:MAG: WD40 repeat domain-containing protein [Ktedonobacteraceae bacterium]